MCLNTGSPIRVDFKFGSEAANEGGSQDQQRRIQEKICIAESHGNINSSTEKDQREDRHPEDQHQDKLIMEDDQGEELHPEDQRQDRLIDG